MTPNFSFIDEFGSLNFSPYLRGAIPRSSLTTMEFSQKAPVMPDTSYSTYLNNGSGSKFGNFVGSLFGGYQNWANSELANYQNSFNQWQQEYSNFYNSPANQAELYEDAGFNKNLIASQSTGSSSMSPISAQAPNVSDTGRNVLSSFGGLINLASTVLGLRKMSAETDAISLSNEGKRIDNRISAELADSSIARKLAENTWGKQDAFSRSAILNYQSKDAQLKNMFNQWLYGDASGLDFESNAISRYNAETQGIDLVNKLRGLQAESSSWSLGQSRKYDDVMRELELDILFNRRSEGDARRKAIESLDRIGVNSSIAKFIVPLVLQLIK